MVRLDESRFGLIYSGKVHHSFRVIISALSNNFGSTNNDAALGGVLSPKNGGNSTVEMDDCCPKSSENTHIENPPTHATELVLIDGDHILVKENGLELRIHLAEVSRDK